MSVTGYDAIDVTTHNSVYNPYSSKFAPSGLITCGVLFNLPVYIFFSSFFQRRSGFGS
jgi:hypothetical protein